MMLTPFAVTSFNSRFVGQFKYGSLTLISSGHSLICYTVGKHHSIVVVMGQLPTIAYPLVCPVCDIGLLAGTGVHHRAQSILHHNREYNNNTMADKVNTQ